MVDSDLKTLHGMQVALQQLAYMLTLTDMYAVAWGLVPTAVDAALLRLCTIPCLRRCGVS